MQKYIVEDFVNSTKLAVYEDERLSKLIIEERNSNEKLNNIYRGRVKKIIKNMNACFIDIGEEREGYLKLSESENLAEGECVLVQVEKEEKGEKRVKLTTDIGISGRYLVYVPENGKIVFSNRIKNSGEKDRIRGILSNCGIEKSIVVRTEAKNAGEDEIRKDLSGILNIYEGIEKSYKESFKPELIYRPQSKIIKYINDHFNSSVDELVINEGGLYEDIRKVIKNIDREYLFRLKKEKGIDVFEAYGVNRNIMKYISRNVWLDDGAYIVIDKTEAMTVIDVNAGSYRGTGDFQENIYRINLMAAREIVKQISFRDISGIILVDFIDMKSEKNRKNIEREIREGLRSNGKKADVHGFTKLGLLEISRRRAEASIEDYYFGNCRELRNSVNHIVDEIERKAIRAKNHSGDRTVEIKCEKDTASLVEKTKCEELSLIEKKYDTDIVFRIC